MNHAVFLGLVGTLALACSTDGPSDIAGDSTDGAALSCSPEDGLDMYQRRIAPLLTDDRPSTCNQCHLSGVDLSAFVQATPCRTMACMAEQGLVNLDAPSESLVLSWIGRAEPDGGITVETIETEHDAMLEWIEMSSACGEQMCEPVADPCGAPAQEVVECEIPSGGAPDPRPVEDDGSCSDLNLELLWREKVYGWRGRCYPCHFDTFEGSFDETPAWITSGACDLGSLTTFRTAERSGYLNVENPMASLLLTKPLEQTLGGVEHGGGPKIHRFDEPSYVDFVAFLRRYAECKRAE